MSFVGRLDDTFVFTRNNDVITFTPSAEQGEKLQRYETNLIALQDAELWSDGVLILGDTDKLIHFDVEDGATLIFDSYEEYNPYEYPIINYIDEYSIYASITLEHWTVGVDQEWNVVIGV